jgi:predicted HicB family RNase H-like nuclease
MRPQPRRRKLKQIHIKLPESLHRELRIQAAIKGQTLQDYVVEAVKDRIALDQSNTHLIFAKESTNDDGRK